MFFWPIGKTRWLPQPLIGWDVFDYSSETAKWNLMKLDRNQILNVLYHVCVFRTNRNNMMAALRLASDCWDIFCLPLWNRLTEFNETWQKGRSQCPLLSLCFSDGLEKQDGRPGQSLKKWHIVLRYTICGPFGLLFGVGGGGGGHMKSPTDKKVKC